MSFLTPNGNNLLASILAGLASNIEEVAIVTIDNLPPSTDTNGNNVNLDYSKSYIKYVGDATKYYVVAAGGNANEESQTAFTVTDNMLYTSANQNLNYGITFSNDTSLVIFPYMIIYGNYSSYPPAETFYSISSPMAISTFAVPTSGGGGGSGGVTVPAMNIFNGKAIMKGLSDDPTQVEYRLENGDQLPIDSVIKLANGQKFIKIDGSATAYMAISITVPVEWNLSSGGQTSWSVLQNM